MNLPLILLLLILWVSNGVFAASEHQDFLAVKPAMSLHEVVEISYQRNPELGVIQARLAHVEALNKRARSLWSKDITLSLNHYNDQLMDNTGLQEWEVGIDMPIWLPGQKAARLKTVQQERSLINASEPALKLRIANIVRNLVWDIALAKNRMQLLERELELIEKLEKDVIKRVSLGDLAESDLILAEQESLSKKAEWSIASQEFAHTQHRYSYFTGLNFLPGAYEEKPVDNISISADHPLLQEVSEKVSHGMALRDLVKLEKRGNPSLFLGTRHERARSNADFSDAISLNFRIPLGLTAHTRPKLTQAEVQLAEARSQREILYRKLNMAIQDANLKLRATQEQYEFARRQNNLAKINLTNSRKAFALGETSLIELIRILTRAFAVESNMHQKHLELGRQTARLNQAKGIIP